MQPDIVIKCQIDVRTYKQYYENIKFIGVRCDVNLLAAPLILWLTKMDK